MKSVLIAGEGRNELGGFAHANPYRGSNFGVLEAILRKAHPDGWAIKDALVWSRIPKYRAGKHRSAERKTVLGLLLYATERKLDIVVFSRDRDSDKPEGRTREADIEAALIEAKELFNPPPRVVGGVAVERLESWILALLGDGNTETLSAAKTEKRLQARDTDPKDTRKMVDAVTHANLGGIPVDAQSLRKWLDRAREAFAGVGVPLGDGEDERENRDG